MAVEKITEAISGSSDVKAFVDSYQSAFADFDAYLDNELIGNMLTLSVPLTEENITSNVFTRVAPFALVDKYQAYQLLSDQWRGISTDLEVIQTEGFAATKQVDPNMIIKKKGDTEEEVQCGWVGHIIPFELVQTTLLREDYDAVMAKEARIGEIAAELAELIDSIDEGDRGDFLNDDNTAFVAKELAIKLAEIYADISTPELAGLQGYVDLLNTKAGKAAKLQYIADHGEVNWASVEGNAPYTKGKVAVYMMKLRPTYTFHEDTLEAKLIKADGLLAEEKRVKKETREMAAALHLKTKETIEGLSDEQVLNLLHLKWIVPLCAALCAIPDSIIASLENAVQALADKYAITYLELGEQIEKSEKELSDMIDELTGNEYDMKGLAEFKALMAGESDE